MPTTRRKKFSIDVAGSVTIESTLVFPFVWLATFLLLLFALFIGQGAIAYCAVSIDGERAAYNWAHPSADWKTGAYAEDGEEPLYWRISDDALLNGLFGSGESSSTKTVSFGAAGADAAGDAGSVTQKLEKAAKELPVSLSGSITYRNTVLERELQTRATSAWLPEALSRFDGTSEYAENVKVTVVEPAEFIRTFDLVRYYASKIKSSPDGADAYRSKASAVLSGLVGR